MLAGLKSLLMFSAYKAIYNVLVRLFLQTVLYDG